MPADDRRPPGQVGERGRAPDGLGLQLDVVVEQQQVVALGGPQRLVHGTGEPARAAEVPLLGDPQPVADLLGRVGEVRVIGHPAGALVDDVDRVEQLQHVRRVAQRAQVIEDELGPVDRGDAEAHPARAGPRGQRGPVRLDQRGPEPGVPLPRPSFL